jgi:hypothetical protein
MQLKTSTIKDNTQAVVLLDKGNEEITIASIAFGISYSSIVRPRKVIRVTIFPGFSGMTDEFYFRKVNGNYELIFEHLLSRYVCPASLLNAYCNYFINEESHSPTDFVSYLAKHHFQPELGYQFPGEKHESN